ncbi:MAG TPA: hypothetical protein VM925_00710 [Labilithrix sp.]|nr:hypothetical protein [Labilithrix sp.]
MRRTEIEVCIEDDDLDDGLELSGTELGLPLDLAREDLDDGEDDLGFRALYERPEAIIRSSRWGHAA